MFVFHKVSTGNRIPTLTWQFGMSGSNTRDNLIERNEDF